MICVRFLHMRGCLCEQCRYSGAIRILLHRLLHQMDFLAVFIKEGFCDCLIQTVLIHSDCNRILQLYNRADLILL